MKPLVRGRHVARIAVSPQDRDSALALRGLCFRDGCDDSDPYDEMCRHVVVERTDTGRIVGTFRCLPLANGRGIEGCYSAQFYALDALRRYRGRMVEVGRFCIHPKAAGTADILRLAWGAITALVDAEGTDLLFGCSSFRGIRAERYAHAFALLRHAHVGPGRWRPGAKAPAIVRFAALPAVQEPDRKRALAEMPPLLRTYLSMGGWVSDHAVIDRDLETLHVFTGLEVRAIPPARARLLRSVAG